VRVLPFAGRVARAAAWAPVCVLVLHEVGARRFGHEPFVDPVMHFLGGMAAAFFLRYACRTAGRALGPPTEIALDLLAFGLTCAVALSWEFGQFVGDQYFGGHAQRGLANTMRDLALGVGGALVYLGANRGLGTKHNVGGK
jgi:hypothetical protein